jgi:hypothetical protein
MAVKKKKFFVEVDAAELAASLFRHSNEEINEYTATLVPVLKDFNKLYKTYFLFHHVSKVEMAELYRTQRRYEKHDLLLRLSFRESLYIIEKAYKTCKEVIRKSNALNKNIQELVLTSENSETDKNELPGIIKLLERTKKEETTNFEKLKTEAADFIKSIAITKKTFTAEYEKYGSK